MEGQFSTGENSVPQPKTYPLYSSEQFQKMSSSIDDFLQNLQLSSIIKQSTNSIENRSNKLVSNDDIEKGIPSITEPKFPAKYPPKKTPKQIQKNEDLNQQIPEKQLTNEQLSEEIFSWGICKNLKRRSIKIMGKEKFKQAQITKKEQLIEGAQEDQNQQGIMAQHEQIFFQVGKIKSLLIKSQKDFQTLCNTDIRIKILPGKFHRAKKNFKAYSLYKDVEYVLTQQSIRRFSKKQIHIKIIHSMCLAFLKGQICMAYLVDYLDFFHSTRRKIFVGSQSIDKWDQKIVNTYLRTFILFDQDVQAFIAKYAKIQQYNLLTIDMIIQRSNAQILFQSLTHLISYSLKIAHNRLCIQLIKFVCLGLRANKNLQYFRLSNVTLLSTYFVSFIDSFKSPQSIQAIIVLFNHLFDFFERQALNSLENLIKKKRTDKLFYRNSTGKWIRTSNLLIMKISTLLDFAQQKKKNQVDPDQREIRFEEDQQFKKRGISLSYYYRAFQSTSNNIIQELNSSLEEEEEVEKKEEAKNDLIKILQHYEHY